MRATPIKDTAILERDFADVFSMINGNSYLSGFTASYSGSSFVFELEAGTAVVLGRIITTTATGDLTVTLTPNTNRYIYLFLRTGNRGGNALEARLVAYEEEQQFIDAILLYYVKAGSAGITTVTDMRVKSLAYRYAHCTALQSPHDNVSLSANTERSVTGTTETTVKEFSIQHPGTVVMTCEMKRTFGTGTMKVYTTSGGATVQATTTATTNVYASKTVYFAVVPGDTITIKLVSSSGTYITYIKNVQIAYDLGIPMAPATMRD